MDLATLSPVAAPADDSAHAVANVAADVAAQIPDDLPTPSPAKKKPLVQMQLGTRFGWSSSRKRLRDDEMSQQLAIEDHERYLERRLKAEQNAIWHDGDLRV